MHLGIRASMDTHRKAWWCTMVVISAAYINYILDESLVMHKLHNSARQADQWNLIYSSSLSQIQLQCTFMYTVSTKGWHDFTSKGICGVIDVAIFPSSGFLRLDEKRILIQCSNRAPALVDWSALADTWKCSFTYVQKHTKNEHQLSELRGNGSAVGLCLQWSR